MWRSGKEPTASGRVPRLGCSPSGTNPDPAPSVSLQRGCGGLRFTRRLHRAPPRLAALQRNAGNRCSIWRLSGSSWVVDAERRNFERLPNPTDRRGLVACTGQSDGNDAATLKAWCGVWGLTRWPEKGWGAAAGTRQGRGGRAAGAPEPALRAWARCGSAVHRASCHRQAFPSEHPSEGACDRRKSETGWAWVAPSHLRAPEYARGRPVPESA